MYLLQVIYCSVSVVATHSIVDVIKLSQRGAVHLCTVIHDGSVWGFLMFRKWWRNKHNPSCLKCKGWPQKSKEGGNLPVQLVELWSPKNEMNLRCSFVLSLSICLLAPSAVMEIHGKMRQLETQLFGWRTRQRSPREEETHGEMAERESLRIATP